MVLCWFRLELWPLESLHFGHLYRFSPVSMRRCFFSSSTRMNDFPLSLQRCGRASANFRPNESPHSAHLCTISLVWISHVFLDWQLRRMTSYNWSKCWFWFQCGWVCAFTEYQLNQITSGSGHKCMPLYCCGLQYAFQIRSLKSSSASSVPGGPKTFGRTKKLEDQKT